MALLFDRMPNNLNNLLFDKNTVLKGEKVNRYYLETIYFSSN